MRKIVNGTLLTMCILTLVNTDYSNIGVLDIVLFICMGIATVSSAAELIISKKKGNPNG